MRSRGYVALALLMTAGPAFADEPSPGERAQAEALFQAAKDLQAQGKLGEACPKYAESNRLDPKPGTALNLAVCHEDDGKTASAWVEFLEAAKLAARSHQGERERYAKKRAEELEKKLSRVTFVGESVDARTELRLDGRPMASGVLGTQLPLDPGPHEASAEAPGKVRWEKKFVVPSGPSELTVEIPSLTAVTSEGTKAEAPTPPPAAPAKPPSGSYAPAAIAAGVAVIGLGVGTAFGVRTLGLKSDVDANCTGRTCNDAGIEANDRARTSATVSTIGFAVGAAGAVGAVILFFTGRPPSASSRAYVLPGGGPNLLSLQAGGAF